MRIPRTVMQQRLGRVSQFTAGSHSPASRLAALSSVAAQFPYSQSSSGDPYRGASLLCHARPARLPRSLIDGQLGDTPEGTSAPGSDDQRGVDVDQHLDGSETFVGQPALTNRVNAALDDGWPKG